MIYAQGMNSKGGKADQSSWPKERKEDDWWQQGAPTDWMVDKRLGKVEANHRSLKAVSFNKYACLLINEEAEVADDRVSLNSELVNPPLGVEV